MPHKLPVIAKSGRPPLINDQAVLAYFQEHPYGSIRSASALFGRSVINATRRLMAAGRLRFKPGVWEVLP